MEFIKFFLTKENMAKLALGDWMFPTRNRPRLAEFQTDEAGWKVSSETVQHLVMGPQDSPAYAEWKDRSHTSAQELFSNQITVEEAAQRMEEKASASSDVINKNFTVGVTYEFAGQSKGLFLVWPWDALGPTTKAKPWSIFEPHGRSLISWRNTLGEDDIYMLSFPPAFC